jgi:hypothetical protein
MSSAPSSPSVAGVRSLWVGPVLRAVPALVVGLIITFTANHSPALGLAMLGAFGLATAVAVTISRFLLSAGEPLRALHAGLAIVAGVVGVLAFVVLATLGAGLAMLLLLVGGYAVLAGGLELVWGIRHRGRHPFARDAVVIGVATLALAVVLALVGDPVSAVGFFGAYAVMLAVFLLIAGFSLKWSTPVKESIAS